MNYSLAFPSFTPARQTLITVMFFGAYFLLGLSIYTHYGISFDEHWGRENGIINAKYMAHTLAPRQFDLDAYCENCPPLADYPDADHGPVFEIATTFLEYVFGIEDQGAIYKLRHLCSFLLFFVSAVFFYFLLQQRFRHLFFSLAGVLMLILSPRLFAESFYNAKDLPFLSLAIISSFTMVRFLNKPSFLNALFHGLACGLALDIRILGLLFPAATVVFSLLQLKIFNPGGLPAKKVFLGLLIFLLFFAGFTIAFWPYLWEHPVQRFLHILARSSKYPWKGNVFYLGEVFPATNLPWHYLPVWFFITTPVGFTVLALIGLVTVGWQVIQSKFRLFRNAFEKQDLVLAGLFVVPTLAAILLKLVLYDAWRHMYFIYPPFVYLAVLGFYTLCRAFSSVAQPRTGKLLQRGLAGALLLYLVGIGVWMVKNHPHQNVYFSIYKDDSVRQKFELDYWGLSYKQGLEFILKDSDKPQIKVYPANLPGRTNLYMLPPDQRDRLVYVRSMAEADYFLTEYRWHPQEYPISKEALQIKVDDIKIFSVFRLDSAYNLGPKELFLF